MEKDSITRVICENDLDEKIGMVRRQTDYDSETAKLKLFEMNMDHVKVIKEYMGISNQEAVSKKSVQQQIYTELRGQMNSSIRDFNKKQDDKLITELESNSKKQV
jgi:hypothetical protein